MGVADIKKELRNLDKNKLIEIITELYRKNKSVRQYFDFYMNPDEKELIRKYKKKVFEAFYPTKGVRYSLKDGKQAITEFKKYEPSPEFVADLMLFYVETAVYFTNDFGDINEAFYSSIASTYLSSLTLMKKENILHMFNDRIEKVVKDTESIGWGLHDYILDVYFSFYGHYPEPATELRGTKEAKVVKLNR
jgi:hypothetical protein